ncbi:MAG TPA: transcription termination/antitermination NusG family protein, partial [Arthrobacter sp.]
MSELELEVTETGLEESPDVTAEAGEESEVESSAPESDDAASDVADADAEAGDDETDPLAAAAATAAAAPAEEFQATLRRQEGDWYVIHSYAGYENRVKANLENRRQSLNMEDYIFQIEVPMEEVAEIKNAQKKI